MPAAYGTRVGAAGAAPGLGALLLQRWLLCPGVAVLDERPPLSIGGFQLLRACTIGPDVAITAGMATADGHLPMRAIENLYLLGFGAIACGLGVDLRLEAADLRGLFWSQPELKLEPPWITGSPDDERAGHERIKAVLPEPFDR